MINRKIIFTMCIAFITLCFSCATPKISESENYIYDLDYNTELKNIPVMSQKTGFTCYAVSMAIVTTHLGFPTTEHELLSGLNLLTRTKGMIPNEYFSYFNKLLKPLEYSVLLLNPKSETELLNNIIHSLENELPVVFFYSAKDDWNNKIYNTHYSVVYGINTKNKTVKISNPYGYLEELSFDELFNGLNFKSYESEPFTFWLGRKTGIIKQNNLFILEKTM